MFQMAYVSQWHMFTPQVDDCGKTKHQFLLTNKTATKIKNIILFNVSAYA